MELDSDSEKQFPLILIVEDNDFMKRILMDCLKGYNCVAAKTIKDAMELFEEHMPDIVFLDMVLPDGSGLDIVTPMIAKKNKVSIFVVSGEDEKKISSKAKSLGVKGYISKPYSKAQIDACMKKFLSENYFGELF
jgi:two-component system KDP operon response regulator KdpE